MTVPTDTPDPRLLMPGDNDAAVNRQLPTYTRPLSDNEVSYFLPARADGVNDMILSITFRAPPALITPTRVATVWAILRLRHQLLASSVVMSPGQYDDIKFQYTPPSSPKAAFDSALSLIDYILPSSSQITLSEKIDSLLNGPRVLSSFDISSVHIIDTGTTDSECQANQKVYEYLFSIAHFIGDAVGTHGTAQSFFSLIGTQSDEQLVASLKEEWSCRWGEERSYPKEVFPRYAESGIPRPENEMQAKAWRVDFEKDQARLIAGHTIPRLPPSPSRTRRSTAQDVILSPQTTSHVLARCQSYGVSVQQALFALCNVAWIRTRELRDGKREEEGLPMMFYTALNYRAYIPPLPPNASFVFLAVGYFNVLLPSSLPGNPQDAFWERARAVRKQSKEHLSSEMLQSRTLIMSEERGNRARRFAAEDDGYLPRLSSPPPSNNKPPSLALLGLTQLGSLDPIYTPTSYPALNLTHVRSTTRKAKGGILLFTFTFRGRLHLSLGWDREGFERGVVEVFLEEVEKGVKEFLVGGGEVGIVRAKL